VGSLIIIHRRRHARGYASNDKMVRVGVFFRT